MKKFLSILVLVISCFVLFILLFRFWVYNDIKKNPYLAGKDTYISLGDGRFEIGEAPHGYSISDGKNFLTIENDIYRYYHDWEKKILYSEGRDGYIVINYETGEVQQHKQLWEFNINIQEIFNTKPFMTLKFKE